MVTDSTSQHTLATQIQKREIITNKNDIKYKNIKRQEKAKDMRQMAL